MAGRSWRRDGKCERERGREVTRTHQDDDDDDDDDVDDDSETSLHETLL